MKKEFLKVAIKYLIVILTAVASSLGVQAMNPNSTIYYGNFTR